MSEKVVEVLNLRYQLKNGRLLYENINLRLKAGEWALITGPNGSGKSTLLKEMIKKGTFFKGYAFLPQLNAHELPFPLTLKELVEFECPRSSLQEMVDVGLLSRDQLNQKWAESSGGEKKKALILRIFLNRPEVLVLDEPFNHLDKNSHYQLMEIMGRWTIQGKIKSVILVSHQLERGLLSKEIPLKEIELDY